MAAQTPDTPNPAGEPISATQPANQRAQQQVRPNDPARSTFWERAVGRLEQTDADFRRARELILGTGALQATLDIAGDYADTAKQTLVMFPAGPLRQSLEDLADFSSQGVRSEWLLKKSRALFRFNRSACSGSFH